MEVTHPKIALDLDLTEELARLINFTAQVAVAIRLNSAYSPPSKNNPNTPIDVMWLSDSLHNFNSLGDAVVRRNKNAILRACISLERNYAWFVSPDVTGCKGIPHETFARYSDLVNLNEAVEIFSRIRVKVEESLSGSPTDG